MMAICIITLAWVFAITDNWLWYRECRKAERDWTRLRVNRTHLGAGFYYAWTRRGVRFK